MASAVACGHNLMNYFITNFVYHMQFFLFTCTHAFRYTIVRHPFDLLTWVDSAESYVSRNTENPLADL